MGAINKVTNQYTSPQMAATEANQPRSQFHCPSCGRDVIFRNGRINRPHFAHQSSDTPCDYYTHPGETQIHKDAKLLMQALLKCRIPIQIYRRCQYCNDGVKQVLKMIQRDYTDAGAAVIEHGFCYNGVQRSADVALLKNKDVTNGEEERRDNIQFIFEICHKHKTMEANRPDPWFEVDAETLIRSANSVNLTNIGEMCIQCIREYRCFFCKRENRLNHLGDDTR